MNNLASYPVHVAMMDGSDMQIKAWMKSTGDNFAFPVNVSRQIRCIGREPNPKRSKK